jgi:hypothetical protein
MAAKLRSLFFSCGMAALAEAESGQIRAVQDPVYHYYLQAYPKDREFLYSCFSVSVNARHLLQTRRQKRCLDCCHCVVSTSPLLGMDKQMKTSRSARLSMYVTWLTYPLTKQPATMVVLGPEASSEYFDISGTILSSNTSAYLNVGNSSNSYLPLSFGSTASTTAWALEGDTIITSTSSTWGRRECCDSFFVVSRICFLVYAPSPSLPLPPPPPMLIPLLT